MRMPEYTGSQATLIWQHLLQFRRIDERDALLKFGCKRLSARIEELRIEHGHNRIKTVFRTETNRATGKKARFADHYRLVEQGEIDAPELGF